MNPTMKEIVDREAYVREEMDRVLATKEALMRAKWQHEEALAKFGLRLRELRDLGMNAAGADVYWTDVATAEKP